VRRRLCWNEKERDIAHAYSARATEDASKPDPSHKKEIDEIP
jgi:hypothetical protein